MQPIRILRYLLLPTLLAVAAPAQGADPMREIQEIARRVDEQLQAIDRLLLESAKKGQQRSQPKELLQQARERSQAAEEGIDKLIEKLHQMKGQQSQPSDGSGGEQGQSSGQEQQQSQSGQQQGQSNRRENQTPDYVQQPKPGEQQQQQQGQQQGEQQAAQPSPPQGGKEQETGGENTRGNRPDQTPEGPGNPGQGEGTWGELQPYVNFLKNRGSPPKVPEKYRKYFEAYMKQKQGERTGGTPTGNGQAGGGR